MQNMNWVAFAISNTLSKSVVHLMPTSNTTNAPYPVTYEITLHAKEFGSKTITLDDGRLGQPDGVRLEDIFPVLNDSPAGLLALSIEMSTSQPKVDLSASKCVVEIITASNSVRFYAKQIAKSSDESIKGMLAVNDAYNFSSLLIVNCSEQQLNSNLLVLDSRNTALNFNNQAMPLIDSNTAMEYNFDEKFYSSVEAQECSWGLFRSNSISLAESLPAKAIAYAVYRDTLTKRIISVEAL